MSKVGVDVGGTKIQADKYADLASVASILSSGEVPTTGAVVHDMQLVANWVNKLSGIGEPVTQVGVAIPGRLDRARRKVLGAGNLTGYVGYDLADILGSMLPGIEIIFGNDGEAQALAEALHNTQLHGEDFLLWAPGTGIATARLLWHHGHPISIPMEGQHGRVCTHDGRRINPNPCGCGVACTETYGSGRAAEELYGIWWRPDTISDQQVWELARAQALGLANTLTNHLVGTVVLGGGIAVRDARLIGLLQEELNAAHIDGMGATIVPSLYGATAGTLGAMSLLQLAA